MRRHGATPTRCRYTIVQPSHPVNSMTRTVIAESMRPVGTTEVHASRIWMNELNSARTSTTALPAICIYADDKPRISRLLRKSMSPASVARTPMTSPANSSHVEKSARIISAVFQ